MLSSEDAKLTSHCRVTDFYICHFLLNIFTTRTLRGFVNFLNSFGNITINWLIILI